MFGGGRDSLRKKLVVMDCKQFAVESGEYRVRGESS